MRIAMEQPKIVSREEWLEARRAHLKSEKALSRFRDMVAEERRRLPWVKVEKDYAFDTISGRKTLAELFDGRSQLLVYHFMFGPGWEQGCTGCSFIADHIDGANLHLPHHDVTLLAVSRAPLAEFLPYKEKMGWRFEWVSSADSDFNRDFSVQFTPEEVASGALLYNFGTLSAGPEDLHGESAFIRGAGGEIFHTYSSYARAGDMLIGAHNWLDLTPLGRNEQGTMSWVRRHTDYEGQAPAVPHAQAETAEAAS
jgi:predicted dithiol-disulfide oxidoreductase (DUF899 family)